MQFDLDINEVVHSIHFKVVDNLLSPHLGVFWQTIKDDGFTKVSEHPPVNPVLEPSENPRRRTEFEINLPEPTRIWFTHSNNNKILQVQRDRFTFNWRKTNSGNEYPGYPSIFEIFEKYYNKFRQFIRENEIGLVTPLHYELGYVYHFPQGDKWNSLNNIGTFLALFIDSQQANSFWSGVKNLNLRASFPILNSRCWLHLGVSDIVKLPEQQQTLQTDFRALNFQVNTDIDMREWFQSAYNEIYNKVDSLFTDNSK